MPPLSLLLAGIGGLGTLFQRDPVEEQNAFLRQRQAQLLANLQREGAQARRNVVRRGRANIAGARTIERAEQRRQGLAGTEVGQRRLAEQERAVGSGINQTLADLDLNLLRQRGQILTSFQPLVRQPNPGFANLFGVGAQAFLSDLFRRESDQRSPRLPRLSNRPPA